MKIFGLQKLTLLDYPSKIACTVFTYGCNFRCPFCHNATLVTESAPDEIPLSEVTEYLDKRKKVLDGVCVTGGEPLLQDGIRDFLIYVKSLGLKVKLDTNGSFTTKLRTLVSEGLVDYVAMDIKNSPSRYGETAGVDVNIDAINKSVEFLKTNAVESEFRTTIVKGLHDERSMREIGEWLKGSKRYYLQKFVDSGALIGKAEGLEDAEMLRLLDVVREYIPTAETRGL